MKKITFLLLTVFSFQFLTAQDASVEKSIFGVQTGFFGVYGFNETKLSNKIALRTEIGLDAGLLLENSGSASFIFTPVLRAEPRWYYNLERRVSRGKRITRNTGNFVSLNVSFNPDLFLIDFTNRNVSVPNQISIVPTWGIRRSLGKHISYETGFGIGYRRILDDSFFDQNEVAVNLHLRIGFDL